MSQLFPVMLPADAAFLGQIFLSPVLAPTPVRSRLPRPANTDDTVHGFMRVEEGDAVPVQHYVVITYNISFLMHAYSDVEDQAALISRTAIAHVAAAGGQTVAGWYVNRVVSVVGGRRLGDPETADLIRYRSAVTWEVAAQPGT